MDTTLGHSRLFTRKSNSVKMVNFAGSRMVDTISLLLAFQGVAASAARTSQGADGSLTVTPRAVPKFSVGSTWQIILRQQLQIPPTKAIQPDFVDVWDIDLFENTDNGKDGSTIAYLKNLPKKPKVMCYFSAGSYEEWRTDWPKDFDRDNYGKPLEGWDGEYWLDLGSSAVQEVMFSRIRLAAKLGCDAVDPDNVDGYVSWPFSQPMAAWRRLTHHVGRSTNKQRQRNWQSLHNH